MSTNEVESDSSVLVTEPSGEPEPVADAPKRKLEISVDISDVGPCKKHLKVSIPRTEIERQYEESLETLRKESVVPGFRQAALRASWSSSVSASKFPNRSNRPCW